MTNKEIDREVMHTIMTNQLNIMTALTVLLKLAGEDDIAKTLYEAVEISAAQREEFAKRLEPLAERARA